MVSLGRKIAPKSAKVRDKIAECSPAWKKYTTASYENMSYAATLLFHGQNCLEMYVGSLWLDINKVSNPCSGYIPSTLNFNANENSESKGGSIINLSMIQSCLWYVFLELYSKTKYLSRITHNATIVKQRQILWDKVLIPSIDRFPPHSFPKTQLRVFRPASVCSTYHILCMYVYHG